MEDIDSMVTDKIRSLFLNELDGFATNVGVVVLATTNHPERLDPAILDRPSRFDRKYYFELPAEAERRAYPLGCDVAYPLGCEKFL
jgi:SpoVK/Ycf46/Vps4 family AAA+-type ATPase